MSGDFEIPSFVTTISSGAFQRARLTNVIIPESVKKLGIVIFYQTLLVNFVFPRQIQHVTDRMFGYCASLTSVTLTESIITIDSSAFQNCINLAKIELPNSLQSIGAKAFMNCYKLNTVVLKKMKSQLERWHSLE